MFAYRSVVTFMLEKLRPLCGQRVKINYWMKKGFLAVFADMTFQKVSLTSSMEKGLRNIDQYLLTCMITAVCFLFRISYSVYECKRILDENQGKQNKIVIMYDIACILAAHVKVS